MIRPFESLLGNSDSPIMLFESFRGPFETLIGPYESMVGLSESLIGYSGRLIGHWRI